MAPENVFRLWSATRKGRKMRLTLGYNKDNLVFLMKSPEKGILLNHSCILKTWPP